MAAAAAAEFFFSKFGSKHFFWPKYTSIAQLVQATAQKRGHLFSQKLMAAAAQNNFSKFGSKNFFWPNYRSIALLIKKISPKNTFLGDYMSMLYFDPKFQH